MKYLKVFGISILAVILNYFVVTFLISLLSYINAIGTGLTNIIKILIPIVGLLIGGFIVGKNAKKKGWLEGLKLGIVMIVLISLFNYLGLGSSFDIKIFVYYLILLSSSIFGSMIGISKKNTN